MFRKFSMVLLIGALALAACGRGADGPVGPVAQGPEFSPKIPQPDLDMDLSDAFGKLGLNGLEFPAVPDIPSESALADPDLLNQALKAYRDLVAFADRLLPVLEGALEGLEAMMGEIPATTPGEPGSSPSLRDMVEGARDQIKHLRDLAGEMAAMLDFLKRREGHFAPGGLALSFEFLDDARVYREFRQRLEVLSQQVMEAAPH